MWFLQPHLAGGAGQSHSPLQLGQDLFLQGVQLVPLDPSVPGGSIQVVAPSVHQVVVDGEQSLVVDLSRQTPT